MDYGGGDHSTADQGCVRLLVVGQSVGAGLAYGPYRLYASSVCDMNSAAAVQVLYAFAIDQEDGVVGRACGCCVIGPLQFSQGRESVALISDGRRSAGPEA